MLKGDKNAETYMIELFQGGLRCVLQSKINAGDYDLVDDLVQETWRLDIEPQKLLEQSKTRILVRQLIGKLKKPRDREMLQSYYLQEDSKDSIRETHGLVSVTTHFNRVMHRARNRFKTLWQSESYGEK
jgi:hypothetical protein